VLKKSERRIDGVIKYMTVAGKKALGDAGLQWDGQELRDLDRTKCGILIGTAMGGMNTFATAIEALTQHGKQQGEDGRRGVVAVVVGGASAAVERLRELVGGEAASTAAAMPYLPAVPARLLPLVQGSAR
jgi:3-oxoacyl-[acyl-carrier-protein] synthase II